MSNKIVIIDYGLGNLYSLQRAVRHLGFESTIDSTAEGILSANYLILPGVGAFGDGMVELTRKNLLEPIRKYADSGKPLLGICLGMQLLLSESEEFGLHKGIDLIHGRVTRFQPPKENGSTCKVPHVGWNSLRKPAASGWESTILQDLQEGDPMYFVHSFFATPEDPNHILGETIYAGRRYCSVIRRNNVLGTQFHPEMSGEPGLSILKRFLTIENSFNRRS